MTRNFFLLKVSSILYLVTYFPRHGVISSTNKYSGPLNNMGLNCEGLFICGFFSVPQQYMIHSWLNHRYRGLTIRYTWIWLYGELTPLFQHCARSTMLTFYAVLGLVLNPIYCSPSSYFRLAGKHINRINTCPAEMALHAILLF